MMLRPDVEVRGLAIRPKVPDIYSDATIVASLMVKQSVLDSVKRVREMLPPGRLGCGWARLGPQFMQASAFVAVGHGLTQLRGSSA